MRKYTREDLIRSIESLFKKAMDSDNLDTIPLVNAVHEMFCRELERIDKEDGKSDE